MVRSTAIDLSCHLVWDAKAKVLVLLVNNRSLSAVSAFKSSCEMKKCMEHRSAKMRKLYLVDTYSTVFKICFSSQMANLITAFALNPVFFFLIWNTDTVRDFKSFQF